MTEREPMQGQEIESEVESSEADDWRDSVIIMYALGVERRVDEAAMEFAKYLEQQSLEQNEQSGNGSERFEKWEVEAAEDYIGVSKGIVAALFNFLAYRDLEKEHENGSPTALLIAIAIAANRGEPAPEWAAMELGRKVLNVNAFNAKSWDEVFGKPHKPRTDFHAIKEWHKKALPMYFEITRLEADGIGTTQAIELCAKKYVTSYSRARQYYYKLKNSGFPFDLLEQPDPMSFFSK